MKISSLAFALLSAFIFISYSCTHYVLYPIPSGGVEPKGDKLFYKNNPSKVFAELRFKATPWSGRYHALKLYFAESKKEVWIYPTGGQIELDHMMSQKIRPAVFDVRFSNDGKYVLYNEPAIFGIAKRKFAIETGIIE